MKKTLIALVAAAGASVATASTWVEQSYQDDVSGKQAHEVRTPSINSFRLDWPHRMEQRATLAARKHPRWGTDVLVTVQKGQLHCEYRNCYISVRFDDGPVQKFAVTEPADNSSETWFIDSTSKFMTALRKSKKTYVELQFFRQGTRTVEFVTADFPWQEKAKVKK